MIRFKLTGDSSELKAAGKEAEQALDRVGDKAEQAGNEVKKGAKKGADAMKELRKEFRDGVSDSAKWAAGAAAAGIATGIYLVNKQLDAIDVQAKLAQSFNTTSASMAISERAAGLSGVSFEKLTASSRALESRLSQAITLGGPVADALTKISLSAEDLQRLPLDQRIQAINTALRDNAAAGERAAIAQQLFGEEGALAMQRLNPEAFATARKEAELFGTALTEIEAVKVEQANDAFSRIALAGEGLVKQFTVQLAPVLTAVGDYFLQAAEEAGGFKNIVADSFDFVIDSTAFVINAVEGIKRAFSVTADGIIAAWNATAAMILTNWKFVLEQINKLPGVDISDTIASMETMRDQAAGVAKEAITNVHETLMEPLPGDAFKDFVEQARVAGEAAASAAVEARENAMKDVNVVDMGSKRTDQEKAEIDKRLEAIRQANLTELELIGEKFANENEAIRAGLEEKLITEQEAQMLSLGAAERFSEAKLAIDQRRADEELRIEKEKENAKKQILSQAFGGLTALMNTESRKMFEIGKAAAISQAVVSTYTGMTKALELGWPLGPIAAAAIGLNGFAQVANIRKQSFGSGGGGSASAGSATQQINANNTPVQQEAPARNVFFHGIEPGKLYEGSTLLDAINDAIENGGQIRMPSRAA